MSATQHQAPEGGGRRLAAIVFTDVVGYSARMQRDETGTLALVRADFERMRALCASHHGEVLKSMGDGLLLCFGSVVQAVACALQIQTEFGVRGPDALQHRIGVHLGDMFREGGDVVGDGVNIAARLQTKARPGTICVSQSVYDAVKGKLPMQVEPLGPQQFKNITEAIRVYLVVPDGAALPAATSRRAKWPVVTTLAVMAAALAVFFWPQPAPVAPAVNASAKADSTSVALAKEDKSIAVLPFTNMSDEKDNAYFADGMHEDILTNLANIGALKVISRTSVMQYRNTTKSIRQIASELQVAYVLEGSVRRVGNKIRVTGQLINARTDDHVWAKAYDRDLTDIFAIQAELSREIASALKAVLSPRESKLLALRPTDNLDAYDLFLRARAININGGNLRDRLDAALPLLNRAVEIDPKFAAAWTQLAVYHAQAFSSQIDPSDARLAQSREALARARQLAPDSLEVVGAQANVASIIGDKKTEAEQVRRMVELFPGKVESRLAVASLAWQEKRWKDALDEYAQALALDPRGSATIGSIQYANLGLRRYDQAQAMTQRLRELLPPAPLRLFQFGLVSYWASGATGELDALLAKYSPEQKLSDPDVIVIQAQWLMMHGQSRELIHFWEQTGPKYRFSYTTGRFERISIAIALLREGQTERARSLLEAERRRLQASLENTKGTRTQQANLALTCALLGDAAGADGAIAAGQLLPAINPLDDGLMVVAEAWLGRTDSAVAALAKAMRTAPVSHYFCNSFQMRHDLLWWPLQGDPRFEALLNDPKNNAPLF